MTDFDISYENVLDELSKITAGLKSEVDERNCANCKYSTISPSTRYNRRNYHISSKYLDLTCMFDKKDYKLIGTFFIEELKIRNRRYSIILGCELPRRRMINKCENHIEEYKHLLF